MPSGFYVYDWIRKEEDKHRREDAKKRKKLAKRIRKLSRTRKRKKEKYSEEAVKTTRERAHFRKRLLER